MGTEKIFGGWDSKPEMGAYDEYAALWHLLAAQAVGTADFLPNFGLSQRRHEIVPLWELYRRAKPKIVVEIGVAQGGTFASWCILGQDDALIIGIDRDLNDCRPRPGEPVHPSIYSGPLQMTNGGGGIFSLAQRQQSIAAINGWSFEKATTDRLSGLLNGNKIDFMFHDASHDNEGTMQDFRIYWPMIADGGVMAFHDIQESAHPDVTKSVAWKWIKENADYSALYEFRGRRTDDSLGLGVLIK